MRAKHRSSALAVAAVALSLPLAAIAFAPPPPPGPPPAPVVTGIEVSGPTEVVEGSTAHYVCTASYSDGTKAVVAPAWATDSAFATIDQSGLLSAGSVGADQMVSISASYNGFVDAHAVWIVHVPPVLTGIEITGPAAVDEGTSAQYTCAAHYSDGASVAVQPVWSVNSGHATISAGGLLAAGDVASDQQVTITATFNGKSDAQAVTIRYVAPALVGIAISGPVEVAEGTTAQYTCTAHYADGSSALVNPAWSENSAHATISAGGVLTAGDVAADQSITVSATFGGKAASLGVTIKHVPPVLAAIAISGPSQLDEGTAAQYVCTATYSDGTTAVVSPAWSENSEFATITASGWLTAGRVTSDQSLLVTAFYEGFSSTRQVVIRDVAPEVTAIAINGPAEVEEGTAVQYTCTASYSDGTSGTVSAAWSQNAAFASISASGVLSVGNVDADTVLGLTASYEGFTAAKTVSVKAVGDSVTYPLQGVDGKEVRAELWVWSEADKTHHLVDTLGNEDISGSELQLVGLEQGLWYWLLVEMRDSASDPWARVHASGWFE